MEEKTPVKGIYILPNLLTTAGLFAGFFAIVRAQAGHFDEAAMAIFIALVMDGLDGRVARLTRTTSDFGLQYDSLVDMVSFGMTPALVLYEWALQGRGKAGWLVAFVFAAAVGLRLARFNTQKHTDSSFFQGLPCPAAAAVVAGLVWVIDGYGLVGADFALPVMLLTVYLALMMVSNLPFRSFKDIDLKDKIPFVATLAIVFGIVLVSFDPAHVLFALFAIYALSGPATWLVRRRAGRSGAAVRSGEKTARRKRPGEGPGGT
ncbi:MAG: phosphatidylcholine/phosphatidylserine synthase [Gammaproteobacteria bacterium]|jgi:CDP-diacylglycerol--serine O-phosphatidyltransferase|nr:phosphatidylcholine/phosphatidylserine synthase [Gammaproteobacteria bacterium]